MGAHLHAYPLATPILSFGLSLSRDITLAPWAVVVVYNHQLNGSLDVSLRTFSGDSKRGVTSSPRHGLSRGLPSIESSTTSCTSGMELITVASCAGKPFTVIHLALVPATTLSGLYLRVCGKLGVSMLARWVPS